MLSIFAVKTIKEKKMHLSRIWLTALRAFKYYVRPKGEGGGARNSYDFLLGRGGEFGKSYVRISIITYCSEFFLILKN